MFSLSNKTLLSSLQRRRKKRLTVTTPSTREPQNSNESRPVSTPRMEGTTPGSRPFADDTSPTCYNYAAEAAAAAPSSTSCQYYYPKVQGTDENIYYYAKDSEDGITGDGEVDYEEYLVPDAP